MKPLSVFKKRDSLICDVIIREEDYFDLMRIFLRLRFNLRVRFFFHLAVKLKMEREFFFVSQTSKIGLFRCFSSCVMMHKPSS